MLKSVVETQEATMQAIEDAEIRKQQAHARAMLHLAEVTAQTVAFCESYVANAIDHAAKDCATYLRSWVDGEDVWFGTSNEYGIARLITKDGKTKYANGKQSYVADGKELVPQVMMDYLRAHGYEVSTRKVWYKRYGFGDQRGYHLEVSWGN